MITYRSRWLKYAERWLDEPCADQGFDVVYHYRSSAPVAGTSNTEYHTLVVNLEVDDAELVSRFHRGARSQIRRAEEEDGLAYVVTRAPTAEDVRDFIEHHREFARSKGVLPLDRAAMEHRRGAGMLVLSRIGNAAGALVWHAYLRVGRTVVLTHSASLFRGASEETQRLVGRANRLHHLLDMRHFRSDGCKLYDMGGWYEGKSDEARLLINRFKEQFGGVKVLQYDAVVHRTLRAKLLKSARTLLPA
ncbi:MAG: hypothetical protein HS128_09595 [Ideonella sp.]|nr:hypothetical protein [Ideonella sp.]MCC7459361.1 hypothetical protein [Nitrospira sp.]